MIPDNLRIRKNRAIAEMVLALGCIEPDFEAIIAHAQMAAVLEDRITDIYLSNGDDENATISAASRDSWAKLMGQTIGIHAGKHVNDTLDQDAVTRYSIPTPIPRGALLGFARIVDTTTESDDPWFNGPIGIVLGDVVAYRTPIVMSGAQGYWRVPQKLTLEERDAFDKNVAVRVRCGAPRDLAQWLALEDIKHRRH